MQQLKRIFVGVEHDPRVVGAARALLIYLLPIGLEWLVGWLAGLPPQWAALLIPEVPLLRALEGAILDQLTKPTQNAVYPTPPAGENQPPAVPAAPVDHISGGD
jgi:hypothetical protein